MKTELVFLNVFPPSGAGEPQYRINLFGEHCLSGASCAAILIRCGGGGTPLGAAHGRKWFWALLPNQSASSRGGPKPRIKISYFGLFRNDASRITHHASRSSRHRASTSSSNTEMGMEICQASRTSGWSSPIRPIDCPPTIIFPTRPSRKDP